jgi:hypothetical protein
LPTVTAGKLGTVTVSALGATAIESDAVADWLGLPLSTTLTEKLDVPLALGVPEITPADERLRPAGREPDAIDHWYPGVPPETCSACE